MTTTTTMRITSVTMGLACWLAAGLTSGAEASVTPTNAPETEMGKLAASLKPGEMKELKTKNCNVHLFRTWYDWEEANPKATGTQLMFDIICYNSEMKWDPTNRQVLAFNGGHYASFKFVSYSAVSNEWSLMPPPPWMDPRVTKQAWPRGHMYDRLAISPEHRLFAANWHGVYLYHMDSNVWSRANGAIAGGKDAYQAMEYFPEMKSFVYESNWGRSLNAWNVEKKTAQYMGSYQFGIHGVMEYNPVYKVMLFGAGDGGEGKSLYLMNKDGKVAKLKAPPVALNCTPTAKLLCDPVSGEYIVKGLGNEKVYAFHPIRDEWKVIEGLRLPAGESLGVSIDTYGVLMFLARIGNNEFRCYLYKHKPVFPADETPAAAAPKADETKDAADKKAEK